MDPAEQLSEAIKQAIGTDSANVLSLLAQLPPGEDARLLTRLSEDLQRELLSLLPVEASLRLLQELPISQVAEILSHMPVDRVAEIFQGFPSNDQADLIAEMAESREALLAALPAVTARRIQQLAEYSPETAGGAMVAEYLSYDESALVSDVIDDLRTNAGKYAGLHVQYAYILDRSECLTGVLRLRDLLLLERHDPIVKAMTADPVRIRPDLPLEELARFFDRHPFFGLPVVDEVGRMLGVVLRTDVEEAMSLRAERQILVLGGILGGEEFRSMRWTDRLLRRGPWLALSLLLSLTAASVIGWYEETLAEVIALAMFLPVISGLGGNSGNQALSISIRELSLGLVKPEEFAWVAGKEAALGIINGVLIGGALALISFVWQRDLKLSVVVGVAIGANTVAAACLGGVLPLALKRLGWDPAVAAGPILFTVVDLFGFLLALNLADHYL